MFSFKILLTVFSPTQNRWKMANLLSDCWGKEFPTLQPHFTFIWKKKTNMPKNNPHSRNNIFLVPFHLITLKQYTNTNGLYGIGKHKLKKTKLRGRVGKELIAIKKDSSPYRHDQVSSPFLKSIFSIFVACMYITKPILMLCSRVLMAFIVSWCLIFPLQLVILILKLNYKHVFSPG